MRLKRPDVIKPIIHMLGLSRPIREIAKVCRVSNSTVLAVLNDPEHAPKIQSQRAHFTTQAKNALRLGIEATVEKYSAPKAKAPPIFDLHLLHQMVALDEGGATSRMEHTFKLPETEAEQELFRIIDGTMRNVEPAKLEEAQVMGSQPENILHLSAPPAESAPGPPE